MPAMLLLGHFAGMELGVAPAPTKACGSAQAEPGNSQQKRETTGLPFHGAILCDQLTSPCR